MSTTSGQSTAIISDNHTMTEPTGSLLRRILRAPFTRRAWAELAYSLVSFPLAVGAFVFTVATIVNGPLWAASAPGIRKLGAASRFLARTLLHEDVAPPPPLRPYPFVRIRTPDAARLTALVEAEGARVRPSETNSSRIRIIGLPASRIAELTAEERIVIYSLRPERTFGWIRGAVRDRATWQARGYFGMKLQLAAAALLAAAGIRLAGLFYLTYPIWWGLARPARGCPAAGTSGP